MERRRIHSFHHSEASVGCVQSIANEWFYVSRDGRVAGPFDSREQAEHGGAGAGSSRYLQSDARESSLAMA